MPPGVDLASLESSALNGQNLRAQRSSIHEVMPGKALDPKLLSQNTFYKVPESMDKLD